MKEESKQNKQANNRSWFNLPNILIALVLLFLLIFLIWNQSISEKLLLEHKTKEVRVAITPTATVGLRIPSEFYSNPTAISGVITAAGVIVVIIFFSALWKIMSVKHEKK